MQKRDEQIGEMLAIEAAVTSGDLGELTPRQRVEYHTALCASIGLNPIASGFQYLKLNGKLILYPTRATTAQLAEKRGLSFELIDRQITDDDATFMVGVSDGIRSGYGIGLVTLTGLRGEARANAIMKADTKARRRGVLDFCGLGMIDESEIASVPGARPIAVDQTTGEILDNTNAGRLKAGNSAPDHVSDLIDEAAEALRDQDVFRARKLLEAAAAHPDNEKHRARIEAGFAALPVDPAPDVEADNVICAECGDEVDQANDAGLCVLCAAVVNEAPPATTEEPATALI